MVGRAKRVVPLGRRVFLLDQQTYAPLLTLTYAPDDTFIRLIIVVHANPHFHPGSHGVSSPVIFGGVAINYARQRATLFTAGDTTMYNPPLAAQRFGLMEILRKRK